MNNSTGSGGQFNSTNNNGKPPGYSTPITNIAAQQSLYSANANAGPQQSIYAGNANELNRNFADPQHQQPTWFAPNYFFADMAHLDSQTRLYSEQMAQQDASQQLWTDGMFMNMNELLKYQQNAPATLASQASNMPSNNPTNSALPAASQQFSQLEDTNVTYATEDAAYFDPSLGGFVPYAQTAGPTLGTVPQYFPSTGYSQPTINNFAPLYAPYLGAGQAPFGHLIHLGTNDAGAKPKVEETNRNTASGNIVSATGTSAGASSDKPQSFPDLYASFSQLGIGQNESLFANRLSLPFSVNPSIGGGAGPSPFIGGPSGSLPGFEAGLLAGLRFQGLGTTLAGLPVGPILQEDASRPTTNAATVNAYAPVSSTHTPLATDLAESVSTLSTEPTMVNISANAGESQAAMSSATKESQSQEGPAVQRKPISYADALQNPAKKVVVPPKPAEKRAPVAPVTVSKPAVKGEKASQSVSVKSDVNSSDVSRAARSPYESKQDTNGVTKSGSASVPRKPRTESYPGLGIINPPDFNPNPAKMRCFVIKSYSADDVHKSIKYGVWASTVHGNKRLDEAYRASAGPQKEPIYLLYSVNGSGCFCGMAQMTTPVDYGKKFDAWAQSEKWSGQFQVKWIIIKNIPNSEFRHIRLANNQGKAVTNSRDTQEVLFPEAVATLKIFHEFRAKNSILDEFDYFDQEEARRKIAAAASADKPSTDKITDTSAALSTDASETVKPESTVVLPNKKI